jgi:3-isopropylmalate/(R)-2-methylmalate dehydratase small subunit
LKDKDMQWTARGRAHLLGNNIPHDGGVISFDAVLARTTDPQELIPRLFAQVDPSLAAKIRPGDFIVAGHNFLAGKAHNNGLLAMKALGLRILCESMGIRAFQGVVALALPCLTNCVGVTSLVRDGDEIEVDFLAGLVTNLSTSTGATYQGLPDGVKNMIEKGGMLGLLASHLKNHPELGTVTAT